MKIRTVQRLDLIAAMREERVQEEIKRHNESLAQIAHQRGVLAGYRERLGESWRGGGVVTAGQAQRAGHFIRASQAAEVQITQTEAMARRQLDAALQNLARTQAHREGLDQVHRKAEIAMERLATLRQEQAPLRRGGHATDGAET